MYSPQALWSAAHYRARVIFFVFNNRRYGVLQNVAKGLGYANAVAGRFVGMDVVEPAIDFRRSRPRWASRPRAPTIAAAIGAAIAEALTRAGPSPDRDRHTVEWRRLDVCRVKSPASSRLGEAIQANAKLPGRWRRRRFNLIASLSGPARSGQEHTSTTPKALKKAQATKMEA